MFRSRSVLGWSGVLVPLAVLLVLAGRPARTQARVPPVPPPGPAELRADRLFTQQNYKEALAAYEGLLAADRPTRDPIQNANREDERRPGRADRVRLRRAQCLEKLQRWDEALGAGLELAHKTKGTVWEPRTLYWLGRCYHASPIGGWRVGERLHRTRNVPRVAGGDPAQPVLVRLYEAGYRNPVWAMEAALRLYPQFRADHRTREEEIQLHFDLARMLERRETNLAASEAWEQWPAASAPTWRLTGSPVYLPEWPFPKKVRFLFARIRALAPGLRPALLSWLGEAIWLRDYQDRMAGRAVRQVRAPDGSVTTESLPYPYRDEKPEAILRRIQDAFPRDPERGRAGILLVEWLFQSGRADEALAACRRLLGAGLPGRWRKRALLWMADIEQPELVLSAPPRFLPSQPVTVGVTHRNLREVRFRVRRLALEVLFRQPRWSNEPNLALTALVRRLRPGSTAVPGVGPVFRNWNWSPAGPADPNRRHSDLALPHLGPGAYLVEATGGLRRSAAVILVSDLSMVRARHTRGLLLFLTRAGSGKPAPGAHVLVRRRLYRHGVRRVFSHLLRAGADGLVAGAAAPPGTGTDDAHLDLLAQDGRHYALDVEDNPLTGDWEWYGHRGTGATATAYAITDRAVYRPGQTVHYRQILMERSGSAWHPAVGKAVRVVAHDERQEVVLDASGVTNEFGSVSGSFRLEADARLGVYALEMHRWNEAGPRRWSKLVGGGGASEFRVEEYRKPEFRVTVHAAGRVPLGDEARVTIRAEYYFGGPVPGARVRYQVFRQSWAPPFRFAEAFDWLYEPTLRPPPGPAHDTEWPHRPVLQGETHTNERGEAEIRFRTSPGPEGEDQEYVIRAETQDSSRRTVVGAGRVPATAHDVAVLLRQNRGYVQQGDRIEVEIAAIRIGGGAGGTPSLPTTPLSPLPSSLSPPGHGMPAHGRGTAPVSVLGTVRVLRQPEVPGEPARLLRSEPLRTDAEGRAFFRWTAVKAGYFRVEFVTHDSSGRAVAGSLPLWVSGPELDRGRFAFQGVELIRRDRYAEEGHTPRVLLVTPAPGCTVLLCRTVGQRLLETRVLTLSGRSRELEIPITGEDLPNVFLRATLVRGGQVYADTLELLSPPRAQLGRIVVTPDRARYAPGERARLRFQVTNLKGEPVRTELSVAVWDGALEAIEARSADSITVFLYGERRWDGIEWGEADQGLEGWSLGPPASPTPPWLELLPSGMGMLADPHIPSPFRRARAPIAADTELPHRGRGDVDGYVLARQASRENPFRENHELARETASDPTMRGAGGFIAERKSKAETGATPRREFADTALWVPSLRTGADGTAVAELTWPDNLTEWRADSVGISSDVVASGEAVMQTRKDVLIRPQTPRFFVERDTVRLSAVVHNYTARPLRAQVRLALEGGTVDVPPSARMRTVTVPPDGEQRVEWDARVVREGDATVRMSVAGDGHTDAVETTIPVLVHGAERSEFQGGMLRTETRREVRVTVPATRKPGAAGVFVRVQPTLAGVMLDALPYLIEYPYGCVEQTTSRFVPAAMVRQTLAALGYRLEDLERRAREVRARETQTIRLPGAHSPYSTSSTETARWLGHARPQNPVFDSRRLRDVVGTGMRRLRRLQSRDGGWGWWPNDPGDALMSAYVVDSLLDLRETGGVVPQPMLAGGLRFLRDQFSTTKAPLTAVTLGALLARDPDARAPVRPALAGKWFDQRARLTDAGKALLALALHRVGEAKKARLVLANLNSSAVEDAQQGTISWGKDDSSWGWMGSRAETNALVLEAYLAMQPESEHVPALVRWLTQHRQGTRWDSTRETAVVVRALCRFVRQQKELAPNYTVTLDYAGRARKSYRVTPDNALFFDEVFIIPDETVGAGAASLTITRQGEGTLYYSVESRWFSAEEPIVGGGNRIAVQRRYYRLAPEPIQDAQRPRAADGSEPNPLITGDYARLDEPDDLAADYGYAGPRYRREPLASGAEIASGEMLEVELELESGNDYDYVLVEDIKPSGCEPVEVRSGYTAGIGICSNVELRDQKVAFFLTQLPQGRCRVTYRLWTETPGHFHVLPAQGYAMYAPEVRSVSAEMGLGIR